MLLFAFTTVMCNFQARGCANIPIYWFEEMWIHQRKEYVFDTSWEKHQPSGVSADLPAVSTRSARASKRSPTSREDARAASDRKWRTRDLTSLLPCLALSFSRTGLPRRALKRDVDATRFNGSRHIYSCCQSLLWRESTCLVRFKDGEAGKNPRPILSNTIKSCIKFNI